MKFISILLKEGRKEDLRNKYIKKMDPAVLDWILNISDLADFNHKYTDWILKTLNPNIDDLDMYVEIAIQLVKDFDKFQSNLEKKDINQYNSFEELDTALFPFKIKEKQKELEKQVDKIYEDNKFLVVKPKTEEASCKYGSNTKWCVTSKGSGHFGRYTSGSQSLYFIINKANSTSTHYSKIAIHFNADGNPKYWDSQDNPMSQREVEIVNYAFPELIEAIKSDYKKISTSIQDIFLKEVFNSNGVTVRTQERYLSSENNLMVSVEGFQTINDLGPGHAYGQLHISLNDNLIDSYQVFITYKPIDKKTFSTSIGFMGDDSPNNDEPFTDLGLEGWGFDSKYLADNSLPGQTAEIVRGSICHRVLEYIRENPKLIEKVVGSAKVWTPNRSSYGYTFGQNKGLIKKLISYLDDGYDNGTKLDFLEYIGKIKSRVVNGKKEYRHSNSERFSPKSNWRGHFSSFFASAKNAGIIQYQKEGRDYIVKKGPNFEAFKSGELKPL